MVLEGCPCRLNGGTDWTVPHPLHQKLTRSRDNHRAIEGGSVLSLTSWDGKEQDESLER